MSARKWGTSGRVTLAPWTGRRGITDAADVLIDGKRVGHAGKDESGWYGAPSTGSAGANSGDLGSFDAGVMHVLRRVDPALWRQERGEVPAVFPTPHGEWMVSYVSGRVVNPSWFDTRTEAFAYAHRVAAKAATR